MAALLLFVGVLWVCGSAASSLDLVAPPRRFGARNLLACRKLSRRAGFNEPSLVFLTRSDLHLTDGADAARFLALPGCRAAFVDIREEGDSRKSLAAIGRTPLISSAGCSASI